MPRVSVCIPTYNTAGYIGKAIKSVLEQDYSDYELIVCDNASTDETRAICRDYGSDRLRYLRFENRTNQAGNFNRCLDEACGEFITILHADDYLLPGFLADRVERLSADPRAAFIFGAVKVIDASGAVTSTKSQWPEDKCLQPTELLFFLLRGCIVSPPSVMVRGSAAKQAGPFRVDLTWGHDWEWTMRLAELGGAQYVSKPLAAYRVHGESGTATVLKAAGNGYQERLILKETLARLIAKDGAFRRIRRPAFRSLCHRHMYFAETALLDGLRSVAVNNLWYAALSDLRITSRPTFWAILAASAGSAAWYTRYRALRDPIAAPGTRL